MRRRAIDHAPRAALHLREVAQRHEIPRAKRPEVLRRGPTDFGLVVEPRHINTLVAELVELLGALRVRKQRIDLVRGRINNTLR